MSSARRPVAVLATVLLVGCSAADDTREPTAAEPAQPARDEAVDGLYHDFLDGKYDGEGHPVDAQVWEAEDGCAAQTGSPEAEGLGLHAPGHAPGTVCDATSTSVGRGRFVVNVRALVTESATSGGCFCEDDDPAFVVRVVDDAGQELATKEFVRGDFELPNVYQNLRVSVPHTVEGPVHIEVLWQGGVPMRVDYVELFRARRGVFVDPPSGVISDDDHFHVELLDPPDFASLHVSCDGEDRTAALEAMLASGEATRVDTEFRAQYVLPVGALLEGCPRPARVMFQMVTGDWARATSRVTVYDQMPPCTFVDGSTRVLLTGFEPFPADSTRDNSSEIAVTRFDPTLLDGVSVMSLVLPVEFNTAADMIAHAVHACEPHVVIGFGQGRSIVDLETTAYNRKDSATFSGGIPDNRGVVAEGSPIIDGAEAELATGLPVDTIFSRLQADGVEVAFSDDPGRYVCNNLFYRLMHEVRASGRVAGFVHLPRIPQVGEEDAAMLQTVVARAVEASVERVRDDP